MKAALVLFLIVLGCSAFDFFHALACFIYTIVSRDRAGNITEIEEE